MFDKYLFIMIEPSTEAIIILFGYGYWSHNNFINVATPFFIQKLFQMFVIAIARPKKGSKPDSRNFYSRLKSAELQNFHFIKLSFLR